MESITEKENSRKGLLVQAGILAIAGVISRIIGLLYGSPLAAIIGDEGNGYYAAAYAIYTIVLLISSYSIPSAMSKIISSKLAVKEYRNAQKIFRCALIYVAVVGGAGSVGGGGAGVAGHIGIGAGHVDFPIVAVLDEHRPLLCGDHPQQPVQGVRR